MRAMADPTLSALNSSLVNHEARIEPPTTRPVCPLCCEANSHSASSSSSTSNIVVLSSCHHVGCRPCLSKWIDWEEASSSGQAAKPPACPFCGSAISDEDAHKILGRPFHSKKVPRASHSEPHENVDEATEKIDAPTLRWINEYTVTCGGCGSFIEKVCGCDLVECLCGYRFCYNCGSARGECFCNPGHLDLFANNGEDEYIIVARHAPPRDECGRVDIGSCIRQRTVRRERERRGKQVREDESERWRYSEKNAAVYTSNGRWLFAYANEAGSIWMLTRQLSTSGQKVHRERERRRKQKRDEELQRWECLRNNADICTSNGRWIFSSKTEAGCISMLCQQLSTLEICDLRVF